MADSFNAELWQDLLRLESRDIVSDWFEQIHGRTLNARRAREIIASARQGREYFRSASSASFAVRPLLAFYGIASLCRSLALLHRRDAGEEGLKQGHGLEAAGWASMSSSDLPAALASIGRLRIRTCGGLFSDLQTAVGSSKIVRVYNRMERFPFANADLRLGYETSFEAILDRLPDISRKVTPESPKRWVQLRDINYTAGSGAVITVDGDADHPVCAEYVSNGYISSSGTNDWSSGKYTILSIDEVGLQKYFPQTFDTHVHRTRGNYPCAHLVSKLEEDIWLPQISMTYMVSFILGMLARYFPTQWNALMAGEKGDAIWPNINEAQAYVEAATPELALDVIHNSLATADARRQNADDERTKPQPET